MRQIKICLAVFLILASGIVLADESNPANDAAQVQGPEKEPDCITRTVRNVDTGATNTHTQCRGAVLPKLPFDENYEESPNLNWVKWFAIATSVLGVIGLSLLLYTIFQNKRTIRQLRRSNELEMRPYFGFEGAKIMWFSEVAHYDPCIALFLRLKNTGKSIAVDVRHPKVTQCMVNFDTDNSASIDKVKYGDDFEHVITSSASLQKGVSESVLRSYFPNSEISREVVNPDEVVEFVVFVPLKNVPASIDRSKADVTCKSWMLTGSFSYADSFLQESEVRVCNFRVHYGEKSITFLKDGTSMSTVGNIDKSTTTGKLAEKTKNISKQKV